MFRSWISHDDFHLQLHVKHSDSEIKHAIENMTMSNSQSATANP